MSKRQSLSSQKVLFGITPTLTIILYGLMMSPTIFICIIVIFLETTYTATLTCMSGTTLGFGLDDIRKTLGTTLGLGLDDIR